VAVAVPPQGNAPTVPPPSGPQFPSGQGATISAAQALAILADPRASEAAKAMAWARLGVTGIGYAAGAYPGVANALGQVPGATQAFSSGFGANLGTALSAAGAGYNMAGIAKSDQLNDRQKAFYSALEAASLIPVVGQFLGPARLLDSVIQRSGIEKSNAPAARGLGGFGRGFVKPFGVDALERSLAEGKITTGKPYQAFVYNLADTLPLGGAFVKGIESALGRDIFAAGPTSKGGQLRQGLGRFFDDFKLPININFQDRWTYEIPPEQMKAWQGNPAFQTATKFGNDIATLFKKPEYADQFRNILLHNYLNPKAGASPEEQMKALEEGYGSFQQELTRRAQEEAAKQAKEAAGKAPQSAPGAATDPRQQLLGGLLQNLLMSRLGNLGEV
jgi:hypothetical protein